MHVRHECHTFILASQRLSVRADTNHWLIVNEQKKKITKNKILFFSPVESVSSRKENQMIVKCILSRSCPSGWSNEEKWRPEKTLAERETKAFLSCRSNRRKAKQKQRQRRHSISRFSVSFHLIGFSSCDEAYDDASRFKSSGTHTWWILIHIHLNIHAHKIRFYVISNRTYHLECNRQLLTGEKNIPKRRQKT